jgi:energy-coupling factor transport system ATP-binding protein
LTEPIILTKNLYHHYQSGSLQKAALIDITLEIPCGSCAAIIGVTGSGKSTMIQHFNGLLRPSSGKVIVDGIDVTARGADMQALRRRVGMLFQYPESQLFEHTIYADVAFGPKRLKLSKRDVRSRVQSALEAVGMPACEFGARSPFELSGGQQRRVAMAGVLAMKPSILVLDEPTTGLDADARAEFYYYLKRVQHEQDVTIVIVSHDMSEVAELADQLFVLHQGKLVMQGRPRDIFSQGEALRAWGLAAPSLSELLSLLRSRGVSISNDIFTLDEAYAALRSFCFNNLGALPGARIA